MVMEMDANNKLCKSIFIGVSDLAVHTDVSDRDQEFH